MSNARTHVILNGKTVRATPVLLRELSPGTVKRCGVFETMRVVDGRIADLEAHLARLARGLKALGVHNAYPTSTMKRWLRRAVRACDARWARLRLSVWQEPKRAVNRFAGCRAAMCAAAVCQPYKRPAAIKYRRGFSSVISKEIRPLTRTAHIKSLDYGVFRRAAREAGQSGADEAILTNCRGELVEGSRTNLFFVKRGTLYTPPVKSGALGGITRRQVIACARAAGVPVRAVAVSVRQLSTADEAFVTNSLIGLMPLTRLNGRCIGHGTPGSMTRKLAGACREVSHLTCPSWGKSV